MADINVVPNNENLTLKFHFNSQQHFAYNIALINRDRNQQVFHASGKSDGIVSFPLGEADETIGLYLIIYWSVIDPKGAGNNYSATAVIEQNGVECPRPQVCSGITNESTSFLISVGKIIA